MLHLYINKKTIIPTRENGEVADGPLGFILKNNFTTNTSTTYLTVIGFIEDLCELYEISNFEYRLQYEEGLTLIELNKINSGLDLSTKKLRECLEAKRSGVSYQFLKQQLEQNTKDRPSTSVIARRKLVAQQYFEQLMQLGTKCLRHYVVHETLTNARIQAFKDISDIIEIPKVFRKQKGSKASLEDLTNLENLMETDYATLVWKDKNIALRMKTMFDLQFHCGLRRGEVLSLQLRDYDSRNELLMIRDRRDQEDDPRRVAPAVKTYERDVYVPKALWKQLEEWRDIKEDVEDDLWKMKRGEQRNDYVFINCDPRQKTFGQALTVGSVDKAFTRLCEVHNLKIAGGSHNLRHLAAMRYVRKARGNPEFIADQLRMHFGWSPRSTMPHHYVTKEYTRMNSERMEQENADFDQKNQSNEGED